MADVMQLGPVQGLVNILWSRESELSALLSCSLTEILPQNKSSGLAPTLQAWEGLFSFLLPQNCPVVCQSSFFFFFLMDTLFICFSLSKATW